MRESKQKKKKTTKKREELKDKISVKAKSEK